MLFTSTAYITFLLGVLLLYWFLPSVRWQNILLVAASYFFYGFVHPWFCLLLAGATLVNYGGARLMTAIPARRKLLLWGCLAADLGVLAAFKYFNFFFDNFRALLSTMGMQLPPFAHSILIPAGISFYTFLMMGYVIDAYWGRIEPCRSILNFALFAAFFPQTVCGPIERANHLLPQIQTRRQWKGSVVTSAAPLLLMGFLKKLVIADNVGVWVDKIFMMRHPPLPFLLLGAFGFAIQIYADFSGYTDIARGTARLFGFELFENFRSPYLAVSPSDFWRRWHISLSTWLRDYLFLPLSYAVMRRIDSDRVLFLKTESFAYILGTMGTMFLAGLWHGAAWNYVAWGSYYGLLMVLYHLCGVKGNWKPRGFRAVSAWAIMFLLTLAGWALFRSPSLHWLASVFHAPRWGTAGPQIAAFVMILGVILFYCSPLFIRRALDRWLPGSSVAWAAFYASVVIIIAVFHHGQAQDFIYLQF
jgi:D-alanyl-lipoteichoic acid acyltransferase DltB (MBOAT superfamily)